MKYAADEKIRLKHKESARRYYLKNKAKVAAQSAAWRKANPERAKMNRRKRYLADLERRRAKGREYCAARRVSGQAASYRERTRLRQREWSRKRSAAIADDYAREQLSKYSPISARDWPQELVEVKKIQIQLKRLVRNKT